MKIAAIAGGLGGARFALALQEAALDGATTIITNVADDWTVDGLLVCPDTDAVLYALSGRLDEERGWGIRGDVFPAPGTTSVPWFSLGEQDRAHHQRRRALLDSGLPLGEATRVLARDSGIAATLSPATDDPRPTVITTPDGPLAFQEWLVRERTAPHVLDVHWPGGARPAPPVLPAIADADVVVLTSSSPVASLEPTLTLPGVRAALVARRDQGMRTVLVSPVVGSAPTLDRDRHRHSARAALLAARGVEHEPVAVSRLYSDFLTDVVLDPADADRVHELGSELRVHLAPILAQDPASRRRLVAACIGREISDSPAV